MTEVFLGFSLWFRVRQSDYSFDCVCVCHAVVRHRTWTPMTQEITERRWSTRRRGILVTLRRETLSFLSLPNGWGGGGCRREAHHVAGHTPGWDLHREHDNTDFSQPFNEQESSHGDWPNLQEWTDSESDSHLHFLDLMRSPSLISPDMEFQSKGGKSGGERERERGIHGNKTFL